MKSIILFLFFLIVSLAFYMGYSERFAYFNGVICQKIGWNTQAAEMFDKGCRNGNLPACVDLGIMAENGIGIEKDIFKARKLYEQASKHGFEPAKNRLKNIQTLQK